MATKKKQIAQKELKAQKRKELLHDLLPLGKSFALWIVLVVIVAWDYTNHRWFSMAIIDYTTNLTYLISKALFIPARILGSGTSMMTTLEVNYRSISVSNYPMIIEIECSAYHAYLAMIALVVFSKWTIKQKLIIGSILFGVLSIVNSLRIVILGVIGHKYPNIFNVMHDYIWNILLVIIIWGLWELVNQKLSSRKHEKVSS